MWNVGFVEKHADNWNIKVKCTIFHLEFVSTTHACGHVYFHFPQQLVGTTKLLLVNFLSFD